MKSLIDLSYILEVSLHRLVSFKLSIALFHLGSSHDPLFGFEYLRAHNFRGVFHERALLFNEAFTCSMSKTHLRRRVHRLGFVKFDFSFKLMVTLFLLVGVLDFASLYVVQIP